MKRIYLLDELRGFAIFCMVFYHAFFTMAYFFNFNIGSQLFTFFTPLEPFFAGLFILISGICSNFSSSNLKRGLKLLIIAIAITLITYFFIPEALIVFGILHMLSISIILFGLTEKLLNKIPLIIGLILTAVLFLITMPVQNGYIGIVNHPIFNIPYSWYRLNFLFPFGIFNSNFYSSDYFPLFPWLFLFLFGSFLGRTAKKQSLPTFIYDSHVKFFSFLGKHSLIIYILHQPVIYFICWLINLT